MRRDSMVFYRSFLEAIEELPEEHQLAAIKAILWYGLNGEDGSSGTAKAILLMARPIIDANNKRYENGKKGGAPKGNQNARKQPKNNLKTTGAQPYVYVNDNVDVDIIKKEKMLLETN